MSKQSAVCAWMCIAGAGVCMLLGWWEQTPIFIVGGLVITGLAKSE